MAVRICPLCRKHPLGSHANTKWCKGCASELRRSPKHTLTPAQQRKALRLRGKKPRQEVADRVNCSVANLSRFARANGVSFSAMPYATNAQLVKQVVAYYRKHGFKETQKQFPRLKIRNIVDRYDGTCSRQKRWTPEQIVQAVRMAGILSEARQAKLFARPGAGAGSVRSLWNKRLNGQPNSVLGLPMYAAGFLCRPSVPSVLVSTKRPSKHMSTRRMVLWVDAELFLRPGVSLPLRKAVRALAKFQRWLWQTENVRAAVLRVTKMNCNRQSQARASSSAQWRTVP